MTTPPMDPNHYFEEIGAWPQGTGVRNYVWGFILSLLLTGASYALVAYGVLSGGQLVLFLAVFALLQFFIQLGCFLHLGEGSGSRERIGVLAAFLVVVFILVAGSVWIMVSLNGRMMPDTMQMEQYMQSQQGI